MAVCRGKASEGLDFANADARTVILVGIPFPSLSSPEVALKKAFLDAKSVAARLRLAGAGAGAGGESSASATASASASASASPASALPPLVRQALEEEAGFDGGVWYKQAAFRALNQALGRAVRHRHDYGAIFLLDERYGDTENMASIAKWLRPVLRLRDCVGIPREEEEKSREARAQGARFFKGLQLPALGLQSILTGMSEFFTHLACCEPGGSVRIGESSCACMRCTAARGRASASAALVVLDG